MACASRWAQPPVREDDEPPPRLGDVPFQGTVVRDPPSQHGAAVVRSAWLGVIEIHQAQPSTIDVSGPRRPGELEFPQDGIRRPPSQRQLEREQQEARQA